MSENVKMQLLFAQTKLTLPFKYSYYFVYYLIFDRYSLHTFHFIQDSEDETNGLGQYLWFDADL